MKLEIFLVLVLGLVNGARILVWPAEWSHWINMKVRTQPNTEAQRVWVRLPNPGLKLRLLKIWRKRLDHRIRIQPDLTKTSGTTFHVISNDSFIMTHND